MRAPLVLSMVVMGGCSDGGPCAGSAGSCIALTVKGSVSGIDQLSVTVDQPAPEAKMTAVGAIHLPVQVGLNLPASVEGAVNVDVAALQGGAELAQGGGVATVTNHRGSVEVTLTDLAGTDLAGIDLAGTSLGTPGAPTNVIASGGDAQATVSWTAPADSGTSAVTGFVVSASPGPQTQTVGGGTTMVTLTGLDNGTTYVFAVAAVNAVGTGPSAFSNPTTPTGMPMAPSAPTNVTAAADVDHGATIRWTASDNHGSALQGYSIMATQLSGVLATAAPSATSAQVTGLTPGMQYTFTVTASNGIGTSGASFPSSAITVATLPGAAPTGVTANANIDHGATVSWTAVGSNGSSDGWSPITKYTVTASPGGAGASTPDGSTTTAQVTGLTPGTSYTFTVVAVNIIGSGPASQASNTISGCVSPSTPEDCFNNIDDNCNGLTDCADTASCPASVATCVAAVGGATHGTLIGGPSLPACPTSTSAQLLHNNFASSSGLDFCLGCTSSLTGTPSATFYSDTGSTCPGALQTTNPTAIGSTCASVVFHGQVFTINNVTGVGCTTPTGTATPAAINNGDMTTDEFCAGPAGGGCSGGNVCVPSVGAHTACILLSGGGTCGGSYPNTTTWNTAYTDGRACPACSTAATSSNTSWSVYSQAGCSAGLAFTEGARTAQCTTFTPGTTGSAVWNGSGTCNADLRTTGLVTAAGSQVTVCCQ